MDTDRRTISQLAETTQINAADLGDWLEGGRSMPLEWISKLCALYGLPITGVFALADNWAKGEHVGEILAGMSPAVFRRLSESFPVELARLLELLGPIIAAEPGLGEAFLGGLRLTVDGAARAGFSTPHLEHALAKCLAEFRRRADD